MAAKNVTSTFTHFESEFGVVCGILNGAISMLMVYLVIVIWTEIKIEVGAQDSQTFRLQYSRNGYK